MRSLPLTVVDHSPALSHLGHDGVGVGVAWLGHTHVLPNFGLVVGDGRDLRLRKLLSIFLIGGLVNVNDLPLSTPSHSMWLQVVHDLNELDVHATGSLLYRGRPRHVQDTFKHPSLKI